jgi:hypothetical protein
MLWGSDDEFEIVAEPRQTHLKHMTCKQIKDSNLRLKKVKFENTITRKNKHHNNNKKRKKYQPLI